MQAASSISLADVFDATSSTSSALQNSSSIVRPSARAKPDAAGQAKEFEGLFLSQMMNHMFSGMESDELMGDPETDEIYRSWMVDEYSKLITASGGIGIADHVQKELISLQEVKK